ncbi:hypothetical protein [Desulfosarcina sp.]|uniref:hypothetical protein n=1 Tax=Desulfosarcina sp. TaxID=2027861 RepID=UPI003567F76D
MQAMQSSDEGKNKERMRPGTKADFIRRIGMEPDLATFLNEFTERPEIFFSLSLDKCQEIESKMDAILSSLGKSLGG